MTSQEVQQQYTHSLKLEETHSKINFKSNLFLNVLNLGFGDT